MNERVIRELSKIGRELDSSTITLPTETQINIEMSNLKNRFFYKNKFIWSSYVKNAIIGLNWAKSHCHHTTNATLLDDIIANKEIDINSYNKIIVQD